MHVGALNVVFQHSRHATPIQWWGGGKRFCWMK